MRCLVSAPLSLASATDSLVSENETAEVDSIDPTPRYGALSLLVFPLLTVFGNVLVCLSIYREKGLHTVTNYFIVSLAIADLMVAMLVMPLAVYVEVNNSIWRLGDTLCDTWVAFDVMCCTSSILNLTAISLDRFIAVTRPIQYAKHKNSGRVRLTLALTWIVSVAVSLPVAVGMNYTDRRAQTPWLCTFYNADFLIYSSMASFYIPCVLMILLYWRIFRAIHLRADRKSAAQRSPGMASPVPTGLPASEVTHCFRAELDSDQRVRTSICPVQGSNSGSEIIPVARVAPRRVAVRMSKMTDSRLTVYNTIRLTSDPEMATITTGRAVSCPDCSTSSDDLLDVQSEDFTATTSPRVYAGQNLLSVGEGPMIGDDEVPHPVTVERRKSEAVRRKLRLRMRRAPVLNFTAKPTPRVEKASTKREKKATKTLAIVLGVFLFCWVPFFTINIMNAICIRYDLFSTTSVCNIDPMAFSLFVWLGYINSFLNPLIYTIFNIEFRKAFKKLLTQPCNKRH